MPNLKERLKRLERAILPAVDDIPPAWIEVRLSRLGDTPYEDSEIIGCRHWDCKVPRLEGETVEQLKTRAMQENPKIKVWFISYRERENRPPII